jgi:hypothetical protein
MINRKIQRDLPTQVEPHRLHRPLIRQPIPIGQQQHLRQHARRDRWPTLALRVAIREIPIAHDPLAVLGQQRIDRVLRQQLPAPRRVKEALLPIRHRQHCLPPRTIETPEFPGKNLRSGRTEHPRTRADFFSGHIEIQQPSPDC